MTKRELRTATKEIMDTDNLSIPVAAKRIGVHTNTLGNFLRYLTCGYVSLELIEKWVAREQLDRTTISVSDILPKN
jgi:transposase